jgi:putative endonuclease
MNYFVYAIYNKKHDKIYIGQTKDLINRLKLHNDKMFSKGYTARFDGEWVVVYNEKCASRADALKREKQLKSYQGRLFVKKIIQKEIYNNSA